MKYSEDFPFENARRITEREVTCAQKAIAKKSGKDRPARGRPPKLELEKYKVISIRVHPNVLAWAKKEAKKRGIGYQTVMNEVLLQRVA